MSAREHHKFQFSARAIAAAAEAEAFYHETRIDHWQDRLDAALVIVEQTIGAKVTRHEVTGGQQLGITIDYGNPEAWAEAQLAERKVAAHRAAAERFRTDQRVYETQVGTSALEEGRTYELDTDDVHHFRLGGQPREA